MTANHRAEPTGGKPVDSHAHQEEESTTRKARDDSGGNPPADAVQREAVKRHAQG
jgi:hypothetical protein